LRHLETKHLLILHSFNGKQQIEAIVQDGTADGFISSIDALNLNLDSQVINFHPHTFFCSSKIEFYFNVLV
jgi:hypothetical protein